MNLKGLLISSAFLYLIIVIRYAFISGAFYWAFWKRNPKGATKLQETDPAPGVVRNEIKWSLYSSILYAIPGAFMIEAYKLGWTQIYTEPLEYGWFYLPFSLLIYMFLHDTYFYWTHRWMHLPKLFRFFHKVHHDSPNPTPWAAFCFHFSEAFIGAIFVPLLAFVIPIHVGVLLALLTIMTICAVINHNGYEFLPKRWVTNWFGESFITATHHNLHHRYYNCNYGLYFRFWDKAFKTDRMDIKKPSILPGPLSENRV